MPAETSETSRLSIPQIRKTWTGHALIGLQRMTSSARAKHALASRRIAFRKSYGGTERELQKYRDGKRVQGFCD